MTSKKQHFHLLDKYTKYATEFIPQGSNGIKKRVVTPVVAQFIVVHNA